MLSGHSWTETSFADLSKEQFNLAFPAKANTISKLQILSYLIVKRKTVYLPP